MKVRIMHFPDFEYNVYWILLLRLFLHPIMKFFASFPWLGKIFFEKSQYCKFIREKAMSYVALEKIYSYSWRQYNANILDRIITYTWLNIFNGFSTRNRLKIVKKLLRDALLLSQKDEINVLSLGAGSARSILEVVSQLRREGFSKKIKIKLIDSSRDALNFSRKLAEELKLETGDIEWHRGLIDTVDIFCKNGFKPDIIEMVGLLDYFNHQEALKLFQSIRENLAQKGILITGNVNKNPEEKFIREIIEWNMIYRRPNQLEDLLLTSGFNEVKMFSDKIMTHIVAEGKV